MAEPQKTPAAKPAPEGSVVFPCTPIKKHKIDVLFADTVYPKAYGIHPGIDINGIYGGNTDLGWPFGTVADGKVVMVSEHAGGAYGGFIAVEHSRLGVWSCYAHHLPGSEKVREGETVSKGEILAGFGQGEGKQFFAHLHFHILKKMPPPTRSGLRRFWQIWPMWDVEMLDTYWLEPLGFFKKFNVPVPEIVSEGRSRSIQELRRLVAQM